MIKMLKDGWTRFSSDTDVVILGLTLLFAVLIVIFFGKMLAPVFTAIIIAYLLQRVVLWLEKRQIPHAYAVWMVYIAFIALSITAIVGLLPLLWEQLTRLLNELPGMFRRGEMFLRNLSGNYPNIFTMDRMQMLFDYVKVSMAHAGQIVLSVSLASIPGLITLIIYFVLVPILVYFFLMDKDIIIAWGSQFLPRRRPLLNQVWSEVYIQIGNYVRGRSIEIILVGLTCYIAFILLGLNYASLLAVLVGFSVLIPYIGAVLVTIPIVLIAFLQWGWSAQLAYLTITYSIICVLDAYVLMPLLFSGIVRLHPMSIILAVLIFGELWGFWGVFFAIPLACVVKAVLNALLSRPLPH